MTFNKAAHSRASVEGDSHCLLGPAPNQDTGKMPYREHEMTVLVARQEITWADRQWAAQYEPGDVVRYTRGSKTHGIEAGEYARVGHTNETENLETDIRENDQHGSKRPPR